MAQDMVEAFTQRLADLGMKMELGWGDGLEVRLGVIGSIGQNVAHVVHLRHQVQRIQQHTGV